jgi:hypothetical protein
MTNLPAIPMWLQWFGLGVTLAAGAPMLLPLIRRTIDIVARINRKMALMRARSIARQLIKSLFLYNNPSALMAYSAGYIIKLSDYNLFLLSAQALVILIYTILIMKQISYPEKIPEDLFHPLNQPAWQFVVGALGGFLLYLPNAILRSKARLFSRIWDIDRYRNFTIKRITNLLSRSTLSDHEQQAALNSLKMHIASPRAVRDPFIPPSSSDYVV